MESYFRALPRKRLEIATAWRRWRDAPDDTIALQALRLPVHRLAGSALTHGFGEIGQRACAIDGVLIDWDHEPADVRDPVQAIVERVAPAIDELLDAMAQAREAPNEHDRRVVVPHGVDRPAVLLVEDDPEQALALRRQLDIAGFDVRAVESMEALEPELALDPPDLLLMDYWLADRTAADLVRELVRHESFARIPRVVLTADGGDVPRSEGRATGFSAVVHKSAAIGELAAILRHAIADGRRR